MYIEITDGIENIEIKQFTHQSVILFGAATYGQKVVEEFENVGANVLFFCDNNPKLADTTIRIFDESTEKEYMVKSPDEILKYPEVSVIIASTYFDEIKEQLLQMGVCKIFTAYMGVHRSKITRGEFHNSFITGAETNEKIYSGLMGAEPFFVGRVGSVELETICHYIYLEKRKENQNIPYQNNVTASICLNAGFFPREDQQIDRLVERYLTDIETMDLIWSLWESRFEDKLYTDYCNGVSVTGYRESCMPLIEQEQWTRALKGKKVLVIHPFAESIQKNFPVKDMLYSPHKLLPDFNLITFKAVQSIAGTKTEYATWFDALADMENQIAQIDFDIALIGAGAYGLPLGAYIKRLGKKAIHIGGVLQLFFGIKGKFYDKLKIYNDYWVNPMESERPQNYKKVESGRYW